MPKKSFALEPAGEQRLDVSWTRGWNDVTISLDGNSIGVIPNQKALSEGQEFQLTDGSIVKIQLVNKFDFKELQVLRNGQPLPGSASDPETRLNEASKIVYFVAVLNIIFGLVAFLFQTEFLRSIGMGLNSILFGLISLPLGLFVQRKSNGALILAMAILILDGLVAFYLAILSGGATGGALIVLLRYFALTPLFQSFQAMKTLKPKST